MVRLFKKADPGFRRGRYKNAADSSNLTGQLNLGIKRIGSSLRRDELERVSRNVVRSDELAEVSDGISADGKCGTHTEVIGSAKGNRTPI